jgi:hypothetical protein
MGYKVENKNRLGRTVGGWDEAKHFWAAKNYADNVITECRKNPACQIRDIFIINEESGATIRRTV